MKTKLEYVKVKGYDTWYMKVIMKDYKKCLGDLSNCEWKRTEAYVVLDGNHVVAWTIFQPIGSGQGWYYSGVYVNKDYRGQGIQKKLIRKMISWIKRNTDAEYIYTYTHKDNYASSNSIIGCGFKYVKPKSIKTVPVRKDMLYWRYNLE